MDPNSPSHIDQMKVWCFQYCGRQPSDFAKLLDNHLTHADSKPDFIFCPENFFRSQITDLNLISGKKIEDPKHPLFPICQIAQKHHVYIIPGTGMEQSGTKIFNSLVFISRDGTILGFYRKRKPVIEGSLSSGDKTLTFQTEFGVVAFLICFDIEHEYILSENLKEKPVVIFNPIFIPSPSISAEDLIYSNWKNAMETMSRQFEELARSNNFNLIRLDQPRASGASSSSIVVGPYQTIYSPSLSESFFEVQIDLSDHNRFQGNPSERERTERRDCTGNRYSLKSWVHQDIKSSVFFDIQKIITIGRSIQVWNFHTRKLLHSLRGNWIQVKKLNPTTLIAVSPQTISVLDSFLKVKHSFENKNSIMNVFPLENSTFLIPSGKIFDETGVQKGEIDIQSILCVQQLEKSLFLIGDDQGQVLFFDSVNQKCEFKQKVADGSISQLILFPNGHLMILGSTYIRLFDISSKNSFKLLIDYSTTSIENIIPITESKFLAISQGVLHLFGITRSGIEILHTFCNCKKMFGLIADGSFTRFGLLSQDKITLLQFEQDRIPISLKKLMEGFEYKK